MAHYISLAPGGTKGRKTQSNRYKNSKLIYYTEEKKLTYTIYKRKLFAFDNHDQWFEITDEYEYRPDKVSFHYYGTVDYWWRIMEVNKMKDILEFTSGKNIRLPSNIMI